MTKKRLLYGLIVLLVLAALTAGYAGYVYASTPAHLRKPAFQHYHFRTQIIVDGQSVKFSDDKFQQAYDKSSCSTEITGTPVDFHDNVDQMTHVHWDGITGGEFLKYFGWNLIGGDDSSLGYRYDQSMVQPHKIKIFGKLLPAPPQNARFYIYTGDATNHERKDWNSFLTQDLEQFLGKQSRIGNDQASNFNISDWLFPKAAAHGGIADKHTEGAKSEAELTRINNLLGNIVIFAQENEPTKEQVQERFNNLVPLSESTCGG